MALVVGFALDQQMTVQKAFAGPLVIRERIGAIDATTLASADLEPVFRAKPAVHRYPGAMARRGHHPAGHPLPRSRGGPARGWAGGGGAGAPPPHNSPPPRGGRG